MGHMYPTGISKLMNDALCKEGSTTANKIIQKAIEMKLGVSCAEGTYYDEYMYDMAVWSLIHVYYNNRCIKFIPKTDKQVQAVVNWWAGELIEAWEDTYKGGKLYWYLRLMEHIPFELDNREKLPIIDYIEH